MLLKLKGKHVYHGQPVVQFAKPTHCMSNSGIDMWKLTRWISMQADYIPTWRLQWKNANPLQKPSIFPLSRKQEECTFKNVTYGSYTRPPASVTITAPPATSLSTEADYANHKSCQTSLKTHNIKPRSRLSKSWITPKDLA